MIYAGDFNVYNSYESCYQKLLSAGNGQAFDPIEQPGYWHDGNGYRAVHTQAPLASTYGGLVGGGMDDRFDFQLVTGELLDDEGLAYIDGSYHALGNNGTHRLNSDISTGTGASTTVLASLETIHPGIPETLDAAEIVSMSRKKELPDAIIEGPLAMDIAVSSRAAEMKGVASKVSGDVDILIVPNIASGNIGVKGLVYLTGAQVGGLILGARRPIVLLSRSDTVQAKLNSIALGALCS